MGKKEEELTKKKKKWKAEEKAAGVMGPKAIAGKEKAVEAELQMTNKLLNKMIKQGASPLNVRITKTIMRNPYEEDIGYAH